MNQININIYKDFSERLKIMMDSNNHSSMDIARAFMIFSDVKPVNDFIESNNISFEDTENSDKMEELFNDFLNHIEFNKPFGFNIEEDNLCFKEGFIQAGIKTHNDLNETTLAFLCEFIYNTSDDRHIGACSTLALAIAYLQTKDRIPEEDKLSYMDLSYCDERGGVISDRLTMKDLINHVEGVGWLRRYLGKE